MAGVETPPFALQNSSHGAQLFRLAASGFLGAPLPGTLVSPLYGIPSGSTYVSGSQITAGHVGGVVGLTDFQITQLGSPNMSVNVAGGQIYIPGGSVANQGLYFGLSDATTNLLITAASPSNPRIDTVIAYVEDAAYSGANNDWKLGVVTGTATAGATLSNLTGAGSLAGFPNCVVLGFVLVPANASSIVTADILNSQPLLSPGFGGVDARGTPVGSMYATAGTSMATGTVTQCTSMASRILYGGFTFSANALIAPVTGLYMVTCAVVWGVNVAQSYASLIWVNGAAPANVAFGEFTGDPSPALVVVTPPTPIVVQAGQSIQLAGQQNSGATNSTGSGGAQNLTAWLVSG